MDNTTDTSTWNLFDKIRDTDTGNYEMTTLLKQWSGNYDLDLLKASSQKNCIY